MRVAHRDRTLLRFIAFSDDRWESAGTSARAVRSMGAFSSRGHYTRSTMLSLGSDFATSRGRGAAGRNIRRTRGLQRNCHVAPLVLWVLAREPYRYLQCMNLIDERRQLQCAGPGACRRG